MKATSNSRLVYSTEGGKACPGCRQSVAGCVCRAAAVVQGDGVVRVSRQSKGRGGKTVTVIKGLALDGAALASLARQLRTACGSGGTVKDGVIEVQGDHCERIMAALTAEGHRPRRSGA